MFNRIFDSYFCFQIQTYYPLFQNAFMVVWYYDQNVRVFFLYKKFFWMIKKNPSRKKSSACSSLNFNSYWQGL